MGLYFANHMYERGVFFWLNLERCHAGIGQWGFLVGRLRLARLLLVETDVGNLVQVDAAAGAGARADVEGRVVCNHLGENV